VARALVRRFALVDDEHVAVGIDARRHEAHRRLDDILNLRAVRA
jgi:hypothetical protein